MYNEDSVNFYHMSDFNISEDSYMILQNKFTWGDTDYAIVSAEAILDVLEDEKDIKKFKKLPLGAFVNLG
jgi:hypothetical protein